jgi:gluconolactonase
MVNITSVNLLHLATSYQYFYDIQTIANASTDHVSFISYHDSFLDILGANPTQELVADYPYAAFHEAGVYNQATGQLYFVRLLIISVC